MTTQGTLRLLINSESSELTNEMDMSHVICCFVAKGMFTFYNNRRFSMAEIALEGKSQLFW